MCQCYTNINDRWILKIITQEKNMEKFTGEVLYCHYSLYRASTDQNVLIFSLIRLDFKLTITTYQFGISALSFPLNIVPMLVAWSLDE